MFLQNHRTCIVRVTLLAHFQRLCLEILPDLESRLSLLKIIFQRRLALFVRQSLEGIENDCNEA